MRLYGDTVGRLVMRGCVYMVILFLNLFKTNLPPGEVWWDLTSHDVRGEGNYTEHCTITTRTILHYKRQKRPECSSCDLLPISFPAQRHKRTNVAYSRIFVVGQLHFVVAAAAKLAEQTSQPAASTSPLRLQQGKQCLVNNPEKNKPHPDHLHVGLCQTGPMITWNILKNTQFWKKVTLTYDNLLVN